MTKKERLKRISLLAHMLVKLNHCRVRMVAVVIVVIVVVIVVVVVVIC